MNYLIIHGSPRKVHTWQIVERIKDTLHDKDSSTTFAEVSLQDEAMPLCIGCFSCFINGEDTCKDSNIIQPIVNKIRECDGLIITSPVYALNTTALMKNFIDHLAYFYHRPEFFNKKALIVVTTAGSGHKKVGKYLDETLRNWGFNQRFKLCLVNVHDAGGRLPLKTKQTIDGEASRFYDGTSKKRLKSPSMNALFMYNLWRALAYNAHIERDYDYWKKNDMLDNEYHPDVPCNPIKKLPFKIFYKIMLNFLSKNSVKKEE